MVEIFLKWLWSLLQWPRSLCSGLDNFISGWPQFVQLFVAKNTFVVAVIIFSLDKITFVAANITFPVAVITFSVAKITFVVAEENLKVAVITSLVDKISFLVAKITFTVDIDYKYSREHSTKHCLHDFSHKQDSQLNSLVLITVWRVVIEVWQDSQLNSSAFSHCSVWRVAIGKGV